MLGVFAYIPLSCITSWENAGCYPQLEMKKLGSGWAKILLFPSKREKTEAKPILQNGHGALGRLQGDGGGAQHPLHLRDHLPSLPAGGCSPWASASSPHFPSHQEGKGSPRWFPASLPAPSWPSLLFAISILFSASPLSLLTKLVSEPIFPAPPSSGVPIPEWVDRTDRYAFAFPFLIAWTTCYTLHTGSEGEAEEACQGKGWWEGVEEGPSCWSVWLVPVEGSSPGSHQRNGWNSHQEGTSPKAWASSGAPVSLPWAFRGFSLPLSS